jgi:hypothetical protein
MVGTIGYREKLADNYQSMLCNIREGRRVPQCSLNTRLGGPHSPSGHTAEDRDLLPVPGNRNTTALLS